MIDCDCRRTDALCDRCVDDGYKQLSGVAACRAHFARGKLQRTPTIDDGRRAMSDVSNDGRLRDRLAAEWLRWATRPTSS